MSVGRMDLLAQRPDIRSSDNESGIRRIESVEPRDHDARPHADARERGKQTSHVFVDVENLHHGSDRPDLLGRTKVNYGFPTIVRKLDVLSRKYTIQELAELCHLTYRDGKVG